MTPEEFATIAPLITVTNASMIYGRVNVSTAPAPVLACLPGIGFDLAQQLVNYRQQNAGQLTSIAWVIDALGANNDAALEELAAQDCITTQGYQFTADIAAVGQYGRGYRRVKYVFDVADGTPRIVYRQDLSHLGWALGRYARYTHGPLRGVEVTAINTPLKYKTDEQTI
jgi:type II secretory pathway component PulK